MVDMKLRFIRIYKKNALPFAVIFVVIILFLSCKKVEETNINDNPLVDIVLKIKEFIKDYNNYDIPINVEKSIVRNNAGLDEWEIREQYSETKIEEFFNRNKNRWDYINGKLNELYSKNKENSAWADDAALCKIILYSSIRPNPIVDGHRSTIDWFLIQFPNFDIDEWTTDQFPGFLNMSNFFMDENNFSGRSERIEAVLYRISIGEMVSYNQFKEAEKFIDELEIKGFNNKFIENERGLLKSLKYMVE